MTTITVNELPTGTIAVEIPFKIIINGEGKYDWTATLEADDEEVIGLESERLHDTADKALNDLFERFGVKR